MNCQNCNAIISHNQRHCSVCLTQVKEPEQESNIVECHGCQRGVSALQPYCVFCGVRVDREEVEAIMFFDKETDVFRCKKHKTVEFDGEDKKLATFNRDCIVCRRLGFNKK